MPKDVEALMEGSAPHVPPEPQPGADHDPLAARVRAVAGGLAPLVARADAVQRERAAAAGAAAAGGAGRGAPRWTDVFTTQFTEFSNRPR